jgi:hypothetical protein
MKLTLTIFTSILICAFSSITKDLDKESEPETKYYYGEVKTTSPDGSIPYGPSKYSLVKRVVDKSKNTINEYVHQGDEYFDTQLKRKDNSNIFIATDSKKSFQGTFTFIGKGDWTWISWEYDIVMADSSGKIIGVGSIDDQGIKTEKYFTDLEGNKQVKITEVLDEIDEVEYLEKVPNKK